MTKHIEERLDKIPVINLVVRFLKNIKLPGFEGLSLYDLLEMYTIGIVQGALTTRASAIAFNFFTAIFPFLLFIIIIIPVIPFENFQVDFLDFLDSFLPPQTSDFFNENIFNNISVDSQGGLLWAILILSIILMANGVSAVFSGFEYSYHKQLTRSVFKQYLYALGVAIILAFLLIVTVGVFGYFQIYIIQPLYEGISGQDIETSSGLSWIIFGKYMFFTVMLYIATATLYYFGTKEGKHSKFFSVGALFTTLLILLTSYLFGVYIENFSKYNELYGSIGALLILLFYLWLNSNILLLGYELNASLQQLKRKF
ncbi:YihY/virulence factor BrkB family protein [Flavobacteriaceae bacterium S0825]|jgi:membrane protein|uniref:YihY/virulence factor BrkB family protein n=1 Tax=Gaetbulibacter sp. S0825 TaxID=2720084 RepID=UPI001430C6DC|nr:YihY/virulence factor BrkB family protein [Gaetbulibacter sp. S0825]MCK0109367.1 YihY/virulence factor BrkB family protein [Flavobacteriaceae bacterium S0825]NIX65001.1 YihY/virulence factor BrkB family protein [Gaetbulibacter sp. S0825]